MDVDSGSGSGTKQTLENTLAACVKCLLQCFSPTLQSVSKGEPLSAIIDLVSLS